MRKVKCRVTGEIGISEYFYKASNGKYYKSEEIYNNYISEKKYYEKIFVLINSDILKNRDSFKAYPFIGKLIKESSLSSKEIYNAILEQKEYLIEHLKNISNENYNAKIIFIFSIATKKLNSVSYAGAYEIRNIKTGAIYIGESINLFNRFVEHTSNLYNNNHHCKALQCLFNKNRDISEFRITPLFMFKVVNNDKKIIKEETLYLESAFYLIAKSKQEDILNTINPYNALLSGNVKLKNYDVDCQNVLRLLQEDKYSVLPIKIKNEIRKHLQSDINTPEVLSDDNYKQQDSVNHTDISPKEKAPYKQESGTSLYRISNILDECKANGYIPQNADYSKIRNILAANNLIYLNENNYTVATEYAISNELYIVSDTKIRKGQTVINYYITEKGRNIIFDIFKNYPNKENLSMTG